MGKFKFFGLLFIGGLLSLLTSCLEGDKVERDEWNYGNAQILSFALSSDDIDLSGVKFTIDQLNGKIYNRDSLPFGTVLANKLIVTIEFETSYVGWYHFIPEATGDTIISTNDSIDYSAPVMLTICAIDGISTKTYETKLNIHQVNPEKMIWERYAEIIPGKEFQDMKTLLFKDDLYLFTVESGDYHVYRSDVEAIGNWEKLSLSGFPDHAILSQLTAFEQILYVITAEGSIYCSDDGQGWIQAESELPFKSLLGYLPADTISGRAAVMCCIAETDGVLRFVTIDEAFTCTQGTVVPETFPLSGFGQFSYETRYYPRLVVASGSDVNNNLSDMTWATMDGITWATLSNPHASFSGREGATVAYYDKCFFVIGGMNESSQSLKDVHFSIDQGITWLSTIAVLIEEKEDYYEEDQYTYEEIFPMPDDFEGRGYMSVLIDKDNYIWLFGGKAGNNTNCWNEIWRGRINRLGFGKD